MSRVVRRPPEGTPEGSQANADAAHQIEIEIRRGASAPPGEGQRAFPFKVKIAAAQDRGRATWGRIEAARPTSPTVDTVLSTYERDRLHGGALLAGALAYRVFFWTLPFALLLMSAAGFIDHSAGGSPEDLAKRFGVLGFASHSISQAGAVAARGRWTLLIIGLLGIYGTSVSLAKALRAAHALIWRVPLPPLHHKLRVAAATNGGAAAIVVWLALEHRARDASPLGGLLVTVVFAFVFGLGWALVSSYLPHAPASWREMLPGAFLVAVGTQLVHLVTVYYVARKLERASTTYGQLGAAASVLLSLYLLARVIVAGAALNAYLYERRTRHGQPRPEDGPAHGR